MLRVAWIGVALAAAALLPSCGRRPVIVTRPAPPDCARWSFDTCGSCEFALGGERLTSAPLRRVCPSMRAGTNIHASVTGRLTATPACFAGLDAVQVIAESPNGEAPRRLGMTSDAASDLEEETLRVTMELPGHDLRAVALSLRLLPGTDGCEAVFDPGATLTIASAPTRTRR